jgi:hypothetical protein
MGAPCSRVCLTACAPSAAQSCPHDDTSGAHGSVGSQRCTLCTKDDHADRAAAPGPSRTCASWEATRLGARSLCCRVKTFDAAEWTTRQPQPARARAAPAAHPCRLGASLPLAKTAPSRAAFPGGCLVGPGGDGERHRARSWASGNDELGGDECTAGAARALPGCGWQSVLGAVVARGNDARERHGCAAGRWSTRRRRMFPRDNTSYMRPAGWPPTMHKCARDPALPCGPIGRPLCTRVQRWDPTLPRVPRRGALCTRVQRRARTQFDAHVNLGPPWSVWPGTPSRVVHKARMRDCQERRGGQPLFSWPGCRGQRPCSPLAAPHP